MSSNGQERARLVALLWSLKQTAGKKSLPGVPYIHFNMLLRQPEYRREIIQAAQQSEHDEIRHIAEQAAALDRDDISLLNPDDKRWLEQRDQDLARAYANELQQAGRQKQRYALIAISLLGALVLTVISIILYPRLDGETVVTGAISSDQRWGAEQQYILDELVMVEPGVTLSIEPGAIIRGRAGSALVIMRGGKLHAKGTASRPILFTSDQNPGSRQPGDWGGVVLLGSAPINWGAAMIEGFAVGDPRGAYGGSDAAYSCGVLEYVRIEFAGFEALANQELNGLTLGGCGEQTIVRNIQVHRALDDGIEIFGGSVNLSRIVITQTGDDGLDWDEGWRGNAQFVIVQQTESGDNAFEGDNQQADGRSGTENAEPRSRPTIYNATLIGGPSGAQRAMSLRSGSGGRFSNIMALNFPLDFADLSGLVTPQLSQSDELFFDAILLHRVGPNRTGFSAELDDENDDGGFDELEYFLATSTRLLEEPRLRMPLTSSLIEPDWVPTGQLIATWPKPPSGEFWDEAATYPGAVAPGEEQPWYQGWTEFPRN